MRPAAWITLVALAAAPTAGAAQELAREIKRVGDGVVRVAFPLRPGAEVCERGFRMDGEGELRRRGGEGLGRCAPGPARVEVTLRGGRVTGAEVLHLGDAGVPEATEIGVDRGPEALEGFLTLAREGAPRSAEALVFAAALADAPEGWRSLLALAEDPAAERRTRTSALFWVGQEAARAATAGLARVARGEDQEQEIRNAAVFALSQRAPDEGIPVLMELARSAREGETRRRALFWLSQADDPRVTDFFRELLGRAG